MLLLLFCGVNLTLQGRTERAENSESSLEFYLAKASAGYLIEELFNHSFSFL